MKKIVFVLMFGVAALCSQAQDAGKILMVKVYEVHPSILNCYSTIKIINPDNTIENIGLDQIDRKNMAGDDANDKKVRETLDKVISRGFELKTSHEIYYANGVLMTTYVFEKK